MPTEAAYGPTEIVLFQRYRLFSPHLGEVARAFLVRVTELCVAAYWRKNLLYSILLEVPI